MSTNTVSIKLHYFILTLVLTLILGIIGSYLVFLKVTSIIKDVSVENIQLFVPESKQHAEQFQDMIYSRLIRNMRLMDAFQKNAETAKAMAEESFYSNLQMRSVMAQYRDDLDSIKKINKERIVKCYERIDQKNLENNSPSTGELIPAMDSIIRKYLYEENH